MKQPPADTETIVECPRCADVLSYGQARAVKLYEAMGSSKTDVPGALVASGVLECRCGQTMVDIQKRGSVVLAIPRPGHELAGGGGIDASVIL